MTNPAAAMRMLITYAICIPVAILVGYLLTNNMDYGTLGFLALVLAVLCSPVFIKWHYPLMIFALGSPICCFFIMGKPQLGQVMVLLSLGIAIVERSLSTQRRFIKAPAVTWPLIFILFVTFLTMKLTGGMGFHSLGSAEGGGKKYVYLLTGIAGFFALISRPIPAGRRNLYIALFFLTSVMAIFGDLFPYLPAPFNYVNLLIPPTGGNSSEEFGFGSAIHRLTACSGAAGALLAFMLVKWGVGGVFQWRHLWRPAVFLLLAMVVTLGGFRINVISWVGILGLMALLERRRGLLVLAAIGGLVALAAIAPFAKSLPMTTQRALSFLPLNWSAEAKMSADDSAEWRFRMWRELWPTVPEHLLLGKGYLLQSGDIAMMGRDSSFKGAESFSAAQGGLALAGDYHSGPLSTLIPFGLWGGLGMVWLMGACLWVYIRNYRHGPPELRTVNTFFLASGIYGILSFIFIYGAYQNDVGNFARSVGFCIALNGGVLGPKPKTVSNPCLNPLINPRPLPAGVVQTA